MWYPNKAQWWVIWVASILAFLAFERDADDVLNPITGLAILWFGGLLVWQLSKRGK
jgi:hypothetical protein